MVWRKISVDLKPWLFQLAYCIPWNQLLWLTVTTANSVVYGRKLLTCRHEVCALHSPAAGISNNRRGVVQFKTFLVEDGSEGNPSVREQHELTPDSPQQCKPAACSSGNSPWPGPHIRPGASSTKRVQKKVVASFQAAALTPRCVFTVGVRKQLWRPHNTLTMCMHRDDSL